MAAAMKQKCPECKKPFAPGYISTHLRRAHEVYGGRSGVVKHKSTALVPVSVSSTPSGFRVLPMIVLQDSTGQMWLAERMGEMRHG